jgi:hypothetical protein
MTVIGIQLTPAVSSTPEAPRFALALEDGGLSVGNVKEQNQALILASRMGEWKEFPRLGVGIADILGDTDMLAWKRIITEQLESDGMRVKRLTLTPTTFDLDAEYV